ncbi:hypothetical protein SD80_011830 [Scytonema tolypothrichoides VB-61278]|nr:hypothetical protein SD80_011830 [Scytonema tolypothrichoides VB-61278]
MTEIAYNPPIDPARFEFTPPADAVIIDLNNPSALGGAQLEEQLVAIAQRVDFPVFVPRSLPHSLVPLRVEGLIDVVLQYVPAEQVQAEVDAMLVGVVIAEWPATERDLRVPLGVYDVLEIGGLPAYFEPGTQRPDGTVANRVLRLIRDGTTITLRSETLSKDELATIATSLAVVPGGKPAPAGAPGALPLIVGSPGPQLSPDVLAAINAAVRGEESPTTAPEYQVVVQAVQGEFVHVLLVPNDRTVEQMPVYLQQQDGQWRRVASGYAPPDDPMWQLLPEEWRPPQSAPVSHITVSAAL